MTDQRSVSSMPGVTLTFVLADGPKDRQTFASMASRETQPLNSARRFHSTDEDHFRGTKFVHESPLGVETSKCCFRRGPAQG